MGQKSSKFRAHHFECKGKTKALLYEEELTTFIIFHVSTKSDPNFLWSNFEGKGKTIALLYNEKLDHFHRFEQKGNPVVLLFNENWPFLSYVILTWKLFQIYMKQFLVRRQSRRTSIVGKVTHIHHNQSVKLVQILCEPVLMKKDNVYVHC